MIRRAALATLALALVASSASADPPKLAPPRPLATLEAPYPAGAKGDAEVLLELVVDATGRVKEARVIEGAEPFASAAIAASTTWTFSPARRDDKPVVAKIRAAIGFHEAPPAPLEPAPVPTPASDATGAAPPPIDASKRKNTDAIEVTVVGEQTPPSVSTLTRAEVRLLPGAFGDPFRAIDAMPGVTPMVSGVPYFFVRGAPPGDVGYYIDGIRVPILFHLGLGPSVVHPALVDRVDLYPGGYPAALGRFAGGVVAGETRPPTDEARGEAVLRLVDAGALVEVPFADGKATALAGGRYSYTALLLGAIAPNVKLRYWDYQARVTYAPDAESRLQLFAFGSYDFWANRNNAFEDFKTLFDTTFHRVDLRYERRLPKGAKLREGLTFGFDQTLLDKNRAVKDRMLAARIDFELPIADGALARVGVDGIADDIYGDLVGSASESTDATERAFQRAVSSHTDGTFGAHADVVWHPSPRIEIIPGLRVDAYASSGAPALSIEPRLAARVEIAKGVHVASASGLASQPPSFFLPGPGFQPRIGAGLQRGAQTSVGIEADLPSDVNAKVTGFYDVLLDATDPLGTSTVQGTGTIVSDFTARSLGSTIGLEVSLHRRLTRRIGGFLAYTLARSTRYQIGSTSIGGYALAHPSTFDRTHVLSAALSFDLGHGIRAGVRHLLYSGTPDATATFGQAYVSRLRPFYRLDARVEKRFTVGRTSWVSVVLEAQNALGAKEQVSRDQIIGPVLLPSIGLEGGFGP